MKTALCPLSPAEQALAEQYFYLVDKFLYRKRLDPTEYFDVAIFGFLKAIQRECRSQNPPDNKNLYGLIEVCMRQAVIDEWRYQGRYIRAGAYKSLSLDCAPANTDDGEFSLYEIVADPLQRTDIQVESKDLAERALAVATRREREVIDLISFGYDTAEIAEILGIAHSTASRILYNFREKAKAIRDDREVIRSPQWINDKEKIRSRQRTYRAAHAEKIKAKRRTYREAHKDEINARDRARRAAKRTEKRAKEQEKSRPRCCEHQGRQTVAVSP